MRNESEVLKKFQKFKEPSENALGLKIKILKNINGEYISNQFDEFQAKNDVVRPLTIPGTPQPNGVADRMNQTLMDMTRCLLIESGLPKQFWADAKSMPIKSSRKPNTKIAMVRKTCKTRTQVHLMTKK